jgi:hypothetical protein
VSLLETDVIDIMLHDPGDGVPELLMIDVGDVQDEQKRHELFMNKLVAYASFVDGDGFRKQFPDATAEQIRVRVVCSQPPNGSMESVQSIVLRDHAGVRLPVVFELQKDMVLRMQRFAPKAEQPARKPWWRFW